jgi:hypothetical protein
MISHVVGLSIAISSGATCGACTYDKDNKRLRLDVEIQMRRKDECRESTTIGQEDVR